MRRQRNVFDTFPETVDLNQGPHFNGFDMDGADELSGFSSWDVGESSSRPNHDSRFKDRQFDHQIPVGTLNMQNSGSNHIPMDVDLNVEYGGNSSNDGPASADVAPGSFGITNERGTAGSFGYGGQSSAMVNSREPVNHVSSQRYFDQRSTNPSQRSNQPPPLMQAPGMPRNLLPFNLNSRANRNSVQDPTNWSVNGGIQIPNLNATTHDQQRSNDYPPWTLFPSSEAESGGHRGHFRPFASGPFPISEENRQGRQHQPFLRSLEVPGDEVAFAGDMEGRHILVSEMRQILNAFRRGENLRAEDYMLFDPFINGVADLHDRHRDMRLDVDNMSYEELLALGERMGDVKTGLTEEVILKSMKQRKHMFFMAISTQKLEPCCICREEYENGDDIGTLDCGHEFHTCCIKQWLTQKNLCPVCKMTGLSP